MLALAVDVTPEDLLLAVIIAAAHCAQEQVE